MTVTERYVYVGGEVEKPGRIIWTPDLTAAKAVQAAGGFTLYAKEDKVGVVRNQMLYELDIKLAQKSPAAGPEARAGRLDPGGPLRVLAGLAAPAPPPSPGRSRSGSCRRPPA